MATTPKTTISNGTLLITAEGIESIKLLNDFRKVGRKSDKELIDFCKKNNIPYKEL